MDTLFYGGRLARSLTVSFVSCWLLIASALAHSYTGMGTSVSGPLCTITISPGSTSVFWQGSIEQVTDGSSPAVWIYRITAQSASAIQSAGGTFSSMPSGFSWGVAIIDQGGSPEASFSYPQNSFMGGTAQMSTGEWLLLGVSTPGGYVMKLYQHGGQSNGDIMFHHVKLTNTSGVPVKFEIKRLRNGSTTTVDVVTVGVKTADCLTCNTVTKTYQGIVGDKFWPEGLLNDFVKSDGNWIQMVGSTTPFTPVNGTTGSTFTQAELDMLASPSSPYNLPQVAGTSPPAPAPATASNTIPVTTPSNLPTSGPTSTGPAWNSTSNTTTTTGLDKDTFREGVNKILEKQNAQLDKQAAQIEAAAELKTSIWDKLKDMVDVAQQTQKQAIEDLGAGKMATKQGEHKTALESAIGSARDTPTFGKGALSNNPSAGGEWEVTWPGVATFNLDPMSQGQIGNTMATMLKAAIAWMAVALFEWWLWTEFRAMFFTAATLPQARGNTVLGSGGQVTALLMAAIIVGVFVSIPGIFWALADSGVTYNINTSPIEAINAPSGARYLFTVFVPSATIATILAQMLIVRKGAIVLVGGAAAVIRACVG